MTALPLSSPVGVVGAGAMGSGIAQVAAVAGHPVLLFDVSGEAIERGIAGIARFLRRSVEKNRMEAAERDAVLARITACRGFSDLAGCGLVVEAVVEDLEVKRKLFRDLESILGAEAILATNTSSLSISAIGASLRDPGRAVGMHFFNPAPLMELVEVVSGMDTDPEVAATVFDTARAWGKTPVHARSTPGFIVNRIARPFYGEAYLILGERAADPATVDAVMREAGGFPMGPFELMDLVGHDVNLAVTKSIYAATFNDPRYAPSLIQQELVNAGRLGRKSGCGFYDYAEGAERPKPMPPPAARAPRRARLGGLVGPLDGLAGRIASSGIACERAAEEGEGDAAIVVDDAVTLKLTDGRTATARADEEGGKFVLFDLALDYGKATRIAVAKADQMTGDSLGRAVGLFQASGFEVSVIDDSPGMIVMRTACMLVNEGAEAVLQGVCAAAVDMAMRKGVNYPMGPLALGDRLGARRVVEVLDNLAQTYGKGRYRASSLLRRMAATGGRFHE